MLAVEESVKIRNAIRELAEAWNKYVECELDQRYSDADDVLDSKVVPASERAKDVLDEDVVSFLSQSLLVELKHFTLDVALREVRESLSYHEGEGFVKASAAMFSLVTEKNGWSEDE